MYFNNWLFYTQLLPQYQLGWIFKDGSTLEWSIFDQNMQTSNILLPEMSISLQPTPHTLPRNPIWLKISATRQFNPKSFNIHISKPFHAIFKKKLLASWKNMAFLVFFDIFRCFWVSFSLSLAVSVCFWHCIWHLPIPDICLTHSDTILTLPDTLRHHQDTHQTPPYLVCMRPLGERELS